MTERNKPSEVKSITPVRVYDKIYWHKMAVSIHTVRSFSEGIWSNLLLYDVEASIRSFTGH